jgi:iron complex outermembrane receptor protein
METGFQHTFVPLTGTRLVWGAEWRRETAYSPSLFYSNEVFSINRARTFANLEWRPHPQWLINAGGLYENHNIVGHSFAPRVMANFHIVPDHTLRVGVTESSRAPGLYELRGDTRYFSGNAMADWAFHSSGTVKAERVSSNEVGYFGRFRSLGLSVDIRAFVERMRDRVVFYGRTGTGVPNNAINTPGPDIHGFEYQFDWRPFATTRIVFAEAQLREEPGYSNSERVEAPHRTGNIAIYQKLPGGFDLSLIKYYATPYAWAGGDKVLEGMRQLDARLAYAFRVGATRGELAVMVQSIGGSHMEYLPNQFFGRRAFTSLRLDF